jgi:hypothetical protein
MRQVGYLPELYEDARSERYIKSVYKIMSFSGSWFRASAMTTMNKKPTRCTIVLKSLKLYCILIPIGIKIE